MAEMIILLCFLSLLSYFIFFRKRNHSDIDSKLPPSPPSLPIIGHLHLLSSLGHKSLQKISTKYGPLLHIRLFNFPVVLVSSASVADEIYKKHDLNISSRGESANNDSLLFGSFGFITSPYGDYWKFMKKLVVTKLLRPQAILQARAMRAEELEKFYLHLVDKATKKECVEMLKEAMMHTNNIICRMTIGRTCSEENGEIESVLEYLTKSLNLAKKIFFEKSFGGKLKKLGISLFKKEIMTVSDSFGDFMEKILVEHEETMEERQERDMMDLLLEAYRDENAEYKLTRNQIKALFLEIFIGGTDTTGQTMQWIMAEVLNNPNIFKKLRAEIDAVVGKTRLIQETDLPSLPYLQAVAKEGLRLHPPGPLLIRMFQKSCEIKEFHVAEKTALFVNIYAMMRDPNVWEDPDEFKPQRFLTSSGSEVDNEMREQSMKYLPFGFGRRGCPGANLAYLSIETAIGTMVQCFDWRIEGEKIHMEESLPGISLTMAHPLKCTPVLRVDPSNFNL